MESRNEAQLLLFMNLAVERPVLLRQIEPYIPPSEYRHMYWLTDFGAVPASVGADQRQWRSWGNAINRMLAQAREELAGNEREVHLYIAGLAALPLWAYLGHCLSKWSWVDRISFINRRPDGTWDILPVFGAAASKEAGEPFFSVVTGLEGAPCTKGGKVAVYISTQTPCDHALIEEFMEGGEESRGKLAGVVELRADNTSAAPHRNTKWLDAGNAAQAASELIELLLAVHNHYRGHSGLVLFIAGAAPLAFMAGRAPNPRMFRPIWMPYFVDHAYQPAVEIPWGRGRKLKLLVITADPKDEARLGIGTELREIREELVRAPEGRSFDFAIRTATRVEDLMRAVMDERPQILHFIGHGEEDASMLVDSQGYGHAVPGAALVDLLKATNDACLDLVVLNSCRSEEQVKRMTTFVDCAIGTREKIADEAGIQFSKAFYRALAYGRPVQNAFDQAKAALAAHPLFLLAGQSAESVLTLAHRPGYYPGEIALVEPSSDRR